MKLTAKVKIFPNEEQRKSLFKTMEKFNAACDYIAIVAFNNNKTHNKLKLHKLTYQDVRKNYNLSAQMAVRAIGKVSEAFKSAKKLAWINKKPLEKPICFKKYGAIVYDQRILSYKSLDEVSILTIDGRIRTPFIFDKYYQSKLKRVCGQADLVYKNKQFFLHQVIEVEELQQIDSKDFLGIDLGIKNILVDSDGQKYSGAHLNNLRKRYSKLRSKLSLKKTKSSKRLINKRKGKEHRHAENVNHIISKNVVKKAKDTARTIVLEDLTGIREQTTVRKSQRRQHNSWSFFSLQQKITYKAKLAGIPVVFIEPFNTSRECSDCGYVSKANRKSQSKFECKACGFKAHADKNAALNIKGRAAVNQPYAGDLPSQPQAIVL